MGPIPRIQPDLLKAPGNDNGHAVVQGLQQVIGSQGSCWRPRFADLLGEVERRMWDTRLRTR